MIEARGLSKHFGTSQAVDGISLSLAKGEQAVISGPSGSGKTTLLRLLAGLESPDAGEIYLNGELASRAGWIKPPHQRSLGFVFQASALWPHMTVAQNVAYGLSSLPGAERRQRLAEVLDRTGLAQLAGRFPAQVSGGQARRAALARSIAPRPKLCLLDEPLVYLDSDARNEILAWIQSEARQHQITLVWVTHNLEDLAGIPAKCYRMDRGMLSESGVDI